MEYFRSQGSILDLNSLTDLESDKLFQVFAILFVRKLCRDEVEFIALLNCIRLFALGSDQVSFDCQFIWSSSLKILTNWIKSPRSHLVSMDVSLSITQWDVSSIAFSLVL